MTLAEIPLVCGLILGNLGPGITNTLGYPYCGISSKVYHRMFVQVGGTSMNVGIPDNNGLRETGPSSGGFERWHWRTEMLIGVGFSLSQDVFVSAGDAWGEGHRLYTSIGVRFFPFQKRILKAQD